MFIEYLLMLKPAVLNDEREDLIGNYNHYNHCKNSFIVLVASNFVVIASNVMAPTSRPTLIFTYPISTLTAGARFNWTPIHTSVFEKFIHDHDLQSAQCSERSKYPIDELVVELGLKKYEDCVNRKGEEIMSIIMGKIRNKLHRVQRDLRVRRVMAEEEVAREERDEGSGEGEGEGEASEKLGGGEGGGNKFGPSTLSSKSRTTTPSFKAQTTTPNSTILGSSNNSDDGEEDDGSSSDQGTVVIETAKWAKEQRKRVSSRQNRKDSTSPTAMSIDLHPSAPSSRRSSRYSSSRQSSSLRNYREENKSDMDMDMDIDNDYEQLNRRHYGHSSSQPQPQSQTQHENQPSPPHTPYVTQNPSFSSPSFFSNSDEVRGPSQEQAQQNVQMSLYAYLRGVHPRASEDEVKELVIRYIDSMGIFR
ncbi:hypothetical protein ABEW05_008659 [Botrytis cinerea]